jgi:hypothetical protein
LDLDYLLHEDDIEKLNIGLLNLSAKELVEIYRGSSYDLKYIARTYFAIIFSMLSLIDNSKIKSKDVYVSILKTQLSDEELLAMFYGCMVGDVNNEFASLVKRYRLLDCRSLDGVYNTSLCDDLRLLQNKTAP